MNNQLQIAVFAGGCFWCTEAVFQKLRGVKSVESGFTGGNVPNPYYYDVYLGKTGDAEAIKFEYDAGKISYNDLLSVFFATHDPTSLNKQGADVGIAYRSTIFYANDEQRQEAENFIKQLEADKVYDKPIVTTLEPLKEFYKADAEHQNFYRNNPNSPYCHIVINPKLKTVKEKFASLIEE